MVLRIYLPLSVTGKLHCAPLLLLKRTLEFVIWSGPRLGKVNTYFFLLIHRVKVFHLLLIQVQHRLDVRLIPSNYRISLRTVGSLCMTPCMAWDEDARFHWLWLGLTRSDHGSCRLEDFLLNSPLYKIKSGSASMWGNRHSRWNFIGLNGTVLGFTQAFFIVYCFFFVLNDSIASPYVSLLFLLQHG